MRSLASRRRLLPPLAIGILLALSAGRGVAQGRPALVAGRTVAEWREDLSNPQPLVRQAAVEALIQFPDAGDAVLGYVTPLISDPDVAVRRTAIRAIGHGSRSARRAMPALWRAWRDDDALVSADAGIALVRLGDDNIGRFRAQLSAAEPRDRARAAAALANAGPAARNAIHALRDHVGDEDGRVRGATLSALMALDATPGSRTASLVGRSLSRELGISPQLDDAESLARARLALALLARAGRDARDARRPLQVILWDGPSPLRQSAAQVLGRLRSDGDKALATAIAAGDGAVRDAALQGLLVERERRRNLNVVVDSLARIDPDADTSRTRVMVEAIGYVANRTRDVDKAFMRVVQLSPGFAPAVAAARRRLAIGF